MSINLALKYWLLSDYFGSIYLSYYDNTMISDLKKLGLSSGEAKVYVAALELGHASVQRIAQKARLKRTSCYGLITSLKERGFVKMTRSGRKNIYSAAEPQAFLDILAERTRVAQSIIPSLIAIAGFADKKPKILFFEGNEGIKNLYKETLAFPESRIRSWLSSAAFRTEGKWFDEHYRPLRIKKKIYTQAILPNTPETREYHSADVPGFHQTRVDASGTLVIDSDILIFGTRHVALISWDEMVGTVIESENIHNTLKSIFEVQWAGMGE